MALPSNIDLTEARIFGQKEHPIARMFKKEKHFLPDHLRGLVRLKNDRGFLRPAKFLTNRAKSIFRPERRPEPERFYKEYQPMPFFSGNRMQRMKQKKEYESSRVMIEECMRCGAKKEFILFRQHNDPGICRRCDDYMKHSHSLDELFESIRRTKRKEFIASITVGPLTKMYSDDEIAGANKENWKRGWFR